MNVVGHDDEATTRPTIKLRAVEQERNETLERDFVIENMHPAIHARRQEIRNIPITIRPDAMQTAQAAWWWFVWIGDAV